MPRGTLALALVLGLWLPMAAAAQPFGAALDLTGRWVAAEGALLIRQQGTKVTAEYEWEGGGRFEGVMGRRTVFGVWTSADGERQGVWDLAVTDNGSRLIARTEGEDGKFADVVWTAVRLGALRERGGDGDAADETVRRTASWQGRWRTSLGELVLRQHGSTVSGEYLWGSTGSVFGSARAQQLTASWVSADQTRRGEMRLTLEPNQRRFRGAITGIESEVAEWQGILLSRPEEQDPLATDGDEAELSLSGTWTSGLGEFELNHFGRRISGSFSWDGGGTLSGTLDGHRMQGVWRSRDGDSRGTWHLQAAPNGRSASGFFWTSEPRESSRPWNAALKRRY